MTTYVLKAWGPYGVASAEIYANEVILEGVNAAQYSKITNYDIREELKVYVAGGLAGLSSKIYCKGVGCYVECVGNACRGMKIYCDVGATCTTICNDDEGTDCPTLIHKEEAALPPILPVTTSQPCLTHSDCAGLGSMYLCPIYRSDNDPNDDWVCISKVVTLPGAKGSLSSTSRIVPTTS